MYHSRIIPLSKPYPHIINEIQEFIQNHPKITSKVFHRRVCLEKYIEALERKPDRKTRSSYFFVALDILRHVRYAEKTFLENGQKSYEIHGIAGNGKCIALHVREESTLTGKQLFLISSFEK